MFFSTISKSKALAFRQLGILGSGILCTPSICTPNVRQNSLDKCPSPNGLHSSVQSVLSSGYDPWKNFTFTRYQFGSFPQSRFCHAGISERLASENDLNAGSAAEILTILKSSEDKGELEKALSKFSAKIDEDAVMQVLCRHRSNWQVALFFFNWASGQPSYAHGSRAYNEMLDNLGRMKKIKLMRQLFDEIPEECRGLVINERTFAILLNRYAGAHKVQEAVEMFYKRKDYGFELDLVGFQILLMSLCRYKHVEEAEALFLQKKDEFPPVIKSWNIILNGWCVMGSLRDTKRVWNEIISSKCKPDLFTYGTFINSLTKAGKLSTAVKLFTSMWEKGINPDVAICNCIIDQLCFKKKIPQALEIFSEMNERGCLADVATYNTLIKHFCKIKRMEKVYGLLDEMEEKGCSPNTKTYTYILKTADKPKDVINLMHRMEKSGCRLDSDTYNLILNLYVGWNYQKGVQQVWDEMERNGSGPDQRSFTIMIHGLFSHGKLDEALLYYTTMKSRGMIPEPRTRTLVKAIHLKKEGTTTIGQSPNSSEKGNRVVVPLSKVFHAHD